MQIRSGLAVSLAIAGVLSFSSAAQATLENSQQSPIEVKGANLVLVFSAAVDLSSSAVEIRDAHSRKVTIGKLQLEDNGTDIKIPLKKALAPGVYTLRWRAVSSDGQQSVGSYAVTIGPDADHVPTVAEK